ncbi:GNAT family N-acetyltransferase [Paenibacillus mesotrionivorans]|jgi:GNAT superfamily N-acetyltransferase|uniref:GNAT family N-acetyltransferase n=1 Tax=Paenibacillus mesotrionivorans TaxID=3160968 RepID=A0ACC7P547_9BACL
MIILQIPQYGLIKPMLVDIPGCLWMITVMEQQHIGKIYVDRMPDPQSVYVESPYFLYYIGGAFQEVFLDEVMVHIISDLIPAGETRPVFVFSSSAEWKQSTHQYLEPCNRSTFGPYLTRRLHHLNHEAYSEFKRNLPPAPDSYSITLSQDNGQCTVRAMHDGTEACFCRDGGQGLGYMDLDVFTHPAHRHKGLAAICCSVLIDYCLEQELIPQWGCWTVNVPSCKLAAKLGFRITAETEVNFAEIQKEHTI